MPQRDEKNRSNQNLNLRPPAPYEQLCVEASFALASGLPGKAELLAEQALEIVDTLGTARTAIETRVTTRFQVASLLEQLGAYDQALDVVSQAISLQAALEIRHDPRGLVLRTWRAKLLTKQERFAEADAEWKAVIDRAAADMNQPIAELDVRLGRVQFLHEINKCEQADVEWNLALSQLPHVPRSDIYKLATTLRKHASLLGEAGLFPEARVCTEEALHSLEPLNEQSSQGTVNSVRLELADFFNKEGVTYRAQTLRNQVLKDWVRDFGAHNTHVVSLRGSLAESEAQSGNLQEARALAEENVMYAAQSGNAQVINKAHDQLSHILRFQGLFSEAQEVDEGSPDYISEAMLENTLREAGDQRLEDDSTAAQLDVLERLGELPQPLRAIEAVAQQGELAMMWAEQDPQRALTLLDEAEEYSWLLPENSARSALEDIGNMRDEIQARAKGIQGMIDLEERRLDEFSKRFGFSREFDRLFLVKDLAYLHIENSNFERAADLLTEARRFLEDAGATDTHIYGSILLMCADVSTDQDDVDELRARGAAILRRFGDPS